MRGHVLNKLLANRRYLNKAGRHAICHFISGKSTNFDNEHNRETTRNIVERHADSGRAHTVVMLPRAAVILSVSAYSFTPALAGFA